MKCFCKASIPEGCDTCYSCAGDKHSYKKCWVRNCQYQQYSILCKHHELKWQKSDGSHGLDALIAWINKIS